MSTSALLTTTSLISFLEDVINSEDLKLAETNNIYDRFTVSDSGVQVLSHDQGEMIRVYSPSGESDGGFYMSMDPDLDKVMFLVSTLKFGEIRTLIKNWKEVKNFISLISGD